MLADVEVADEFGEARAIEPLAIAIGAVTKPFGNGLAPKGAQMSSRISANGNTVFSCDMDLIT